MQPCIAMTWIFKVLKTQNKIPHHVVTVIFQEVSKLCRRTTLDLGPNGQIAKGDQNGKIAICYDGESSEDLLGRKITINMSGRTVIKTMAPGESCTPDGA